MVVTIYDIVEPLEQFIQGRARRSPSD